jgi:hypothetical protein
MNTRVGHPKYPELGVGEVINETNGKATVEFEDKTIVFPLVDLEVIPSRDVVYAYRDGEKIALGEVKKEQIDFVVAQSQDWVSVDDLVKKVTKHFSEYTMEDGSPLNQGGFDPMFCVSRKNPGILIRTGKLIFSKAPKNSGCQWLFKSRAAASQQEILAAVDCALAKDKFVFAETTDANSDRLGVQAVDSCVTA